MQFPAFLRADVIKKVKTSDLRVGMYVHDLNIPWLEHGFVRSHFLLKSEHQIEKILNANIAEVVIDTERGLDAEHAPTLEEAESALMNTIIDIVSEPASTKFVAGALNMQWTESRQIHDEALKVVSNILNDVQNGKQTGVLRATPLVENITNAILGGNGTLVSLCRIKNSDAYTFQHSVSVSALLVTLCHSLGSFNSKELIEIGLGGLFHDIGKMKVPGEILNKPGPLTDDEFTIMKTHVDEGLEYLQAEHNLSSPALKIVAEHHERYDGTGYPRELSQNTISQIGQMASIVDVYDAITSTRVYHSALEPTDALKRIFEWGGKHFDEAMVHNFIKAIGIYPVGSLIRLDSGRLAFVLRQGEKSMLQPFVRVVYDAGHGHRLLPKDIDLASPTCQDHIVGCEVPGTWGIDPTRFIGKH